MPEISTSGKKTLKESYASLMFFILLIHLGKKKGWIEGIWMGYEKKHCFVDGVEVWGEMND